MLSQPLVWIDLEMTGLDPEQDTIVEIAVIVTDGQLRTQIEGPELVISTSSEALAHMSDLVRTMHSESGLLDRIAAGGIRIEDAERQIMSFIDAHVHPDDTPVLAGNSVHTDRTFVRRYLPVLDARLHYRHIDVSTIKELALRWSPELLDEAPPKGGSHRALADIRESIAELQFYRNRFFGPAAQEPQ